MNDKGKSKFLKIMPGHAIMHPHDICMTYNRLSLNVNCRKWATTAISHLLMTDTVMQVVLDYKYILKWLTVNQHNMQVCFALYIIGFLFKNILETLYLLVQGDNMQVSHI